MEKIYERHCEVCSLGARAIGNDEAGELMVNIPAWKKGFHDGVEKLTREFHFVEFDDAFSFTYKLAKLAEREKHHPAVLTEWGKVTVYWWTHRINGLHMNDFIMASKTDLLSKMSSRSAGNSK